MSKTILSTRYLIEILTVSFLSCPLEVMVFSLSGMKKMEINIAFNFIFLHHMHHLFH
jgi:hypothetical protein